MRRFGGAIERMEVAADKLDSHFAWPISPSIFGIAILLFAFLVGGVSLELLKTIVPGSNITNWFDSHFEAVIAAVGGLVLAALFIKFCADQIAPSGDASDPYRVKDDANG